MGGNAFTLMIVCLSPSATHLEETLNTLKFAVRAANICNRPVANVRITPITTIPLMAMAINSRPFLENGIPDHIVQPGIQKFQLNGASSACQPNSDSETEESQTEFHGEQADGDEVFRLECINLTNF